MLPGEQRRLGRSLLKLRVIPRAGHCQCTDIFVRLSQTVSHYGPSPPSCNVIVQCVDDMCPRPEFPHREVMSDKNTFSVTQASPLPAP